MPDDVRRQSRRQRRILRNVVPGSLLLWAPRDGVVMVAWRVPGRVGLLYDGTQTKSVTAEWLAERLRSGGCRLIG